MGMSGSQYEHNPHPNDSDLVQPFLPRAQNLFHIPISCIITIDKTLLFQIPQKLIIPRILIMDRGILRGLFDNTYFGNIHVPHMKYLNELWRRSWVRETHIEVVSG
jgi:hypothetical protein